MSALRVEHLSGEAGFSEDAIRSAAAVIAGFGDPCYASFVLLVSPQNTFAAARLQKAIADEPGGPANRAERGIQSLHITTVHTWRGSRWAMLGADVMVVS